jgi:hypothetical protein
VNVVVMVQVSDEEEGLVCAMELNFTCECWPSEMEINFTCECFCPGAGVTDEEGC